MMDKKLLTFLTSSALFCAVVVSGCSEKTPPPEPKKEPAAAASKELDIPELVTMMVQVSNAANEQNPDGIARLSAFAKHPDYLIRVEAMKALGNDYFRKTTGGHEELLTAVNDEHWLVRSIAIKALAKEYHTGTLEVLRERQQVEQHERVQRYLQGAIDNLQTLQKTKS